jgi:hypothetical protein
MTDDDLECLKYCVNLYGIMKSTATVALKNVLSFSLSFYIYTSICVCVRVCVNQVSN